MSLLKNLNAKQRRNIILGGAAGLFLVGIFAVSRPGVLTSNAPPVNAGNLLGNADSHALGIASINTQVASQKDDLGALKQQMNILQKQNQQLQDHKGDTTGLAATGTSSGSPVPGSGTPAFAGQQILPPVPTVGQGGINMPSGYQGRANGMPGGNGNGNGNESSEGGAPSITTTEADVPAKSKDGTNSSASVNRTADTNSSDTSSGDSETKPKPKEPKVFIPAGTMLTGVLITGLDAPTGREAASQPIPLLIRVKEEAILPNEYRADYRECFIVASGVGDLSSERAYLRGETLSCVANNGGVIQANLKMWGTGEDGKAGMRGTLVSKQGSILAKAILAGFASGIGQAFTPQQQTTISTTGSSYQQIPLATAGRMAGLGGVSSGANQIAEYYLKMAESEFPVIEISAGRPVTFIVEKGDSLSKLEETK